MYLLSSSFRRIALLLNVGKIVHYWVEKFKLLSLKGERKSKSLQFELLLMNPF